LSPGSLTTFGNPALCNGTAARLQKPMSNFAPFLVLVCTKEWKEIAMKTKQSPFQKALDMVETLPTDQQSDLADIVRRRLAERRRDEIAAGIREAKADYRAGKVKKGTVADLMRDLRS